jgi:hypothetical protein
MNKGMWTIGIALELIFEVSGSLWVGTAGDIEVGY